MHKVSDQQLEAKHLLWKKMVIRQSHLLKAYTYLYECANKDVGMEKFTQAAVEHLGRAIIVGREIFDICNVMDRKRFELALQNGYYNEIYRKSIESNEH